MEENSHMGKRPSTTTAVEDTAALPTCPEGSASHSSKMLPQTKTQDCFVGCLLLLLDTQLLFGLASLGVYG